MTPSFRAFAVVAALAAGLLISAQAQAFTIEGGPGASGPSTNWRDLDLAKPKATDPESRFSSEDGRTMYKSGNSTFYFGQQPSFNQRYNSNNLFDPYAREGR